MSGAQAKAAVIAGCVGVVAEVIDDYWWCGRGRLSIVVITGMVAEVRW